MFTEKDIQQFEAKGLQVDQVEDQIDLFKKGLPNANLYEAATIGNGILKFAASDMETYIDFYEKQIDNLEVIKFVPASGAATRMFKFLFEFLNEFNPETETFNAYVNRKNDDDIELFFVGVDIAVCVGVEVPVMVMITVSASKRLIADRFW